MKQFLLASCCALLAVCSDFGQGADRVLAQAADAPTSTRLAENAATDAPVDPLLGLSPVCVAPAQQGGGFDMTCRLVKALLDQSATFAAPVRTEFVPGGVGAVAFNRVVTEQRDDPAALIAFSEGSIYNLAFGKYGPRGFSDVRWLTEIATDYGVIWTCPALVESV